MKENKDFTAMISPFSTEELDVFTKVQYCAATASSVTPPSSQSSSPLKTFLNILFYLAVVPFRLEWNPEYGEFILKRNRIQMLVCVIVHLASFGFAVSFYVINYYEMFTFSSNISQLLGTIGYLSATCASIHVVKVFWLNPKEILKFLTMSQKVFQKTMGDSPKPKIDAISFLVLLITVVSYLSQVGVGHITDLGSSSAEGILGLFQSYDSIDSYKYRIKNESTSSLKSMSVPRILFHALITHSTTLHPMSRVIILVLCLEFFLLGKRFEKVVEEERLMVKIVGKFEELQKITTMNRKWSNGLILENSVGVLAFLATIPQLIRTGSPEHSDYTGVQKLFLGLNYALFGVFLGVAADMPSRVRDSLKSWISHKRIQEGLTKDDKFLILSLSQEIEVESVGVSCTFFTLTFSFLGSMMSLVATYGVLVFQMQT